MSRLLKFFVMAYAPLALRYRLLDADDGMRGGFRTRTPRSRAADPKARQRVAAPSPPACVQAGSLAA